MIKSNTCITQANRLIVVKQNAVCHNYHNVGEEFLIVYVATSDAATQLPHHRKLIQAEEVSVQDKRIYWSYFHRP